MTGFLILAAILVAGALLLVVPPMLGFGKRRKAHGERRRQADIALVVLREQLAELESEHAAGRIPDDEYHRSREELERRALEEGRAADDGADVRSASGWAVGLMVAVPICAAVVYLAIGEPDALDPVKVAGEPPHQISPEQMAGLVEQLVDRLDHDPSDPMGWLMLVRSYAMLEDLDGAARAWARIGDKAPDDAGILADWADILVVGRDGDFSGEPDRLIARALELEPDHVKALALAGTAEFQRGNHARAAELWERILVQIPPSEEAYGSVLGSVNEARILAGLEALPAPGQAASVGERPGQAAVPAAPAAVDSALGVSGRLRIAPELAATLEGSETVFVFVRPVQGGIPVAALRYSVSELPLEFEFKGAPLMTDAPLPEQVTVAARVSRGGDATARAGDLEGQSGPIGLDQHDVELVIDRVRD